MALIRTCKPEPGNVFYNTGSKGISTCRYGNTDNNWFKGQLPGLNVLPNCVGFASGAFNETFNSVVNPNGIPKFYFSGLNCGAAGFIDRAKTLSACGYSLKNYILPKTATPTVGGIMVWGANHVAYVYKVVDQNTVFTLESNWKLGKPFIRFSDGSDKRPDDMYNGLPRRRGTGNWGISNYLGCIANPVVTDASTLEYISSPPLHGEPYVATIEEKVIDGVDTIRLAINPGGSSDKPITLTTYYVFNEDINKLSEEYIKNKDNSSNLNIRVENNAVKNTAFYVDIEDSIFYKKIGVILKQEQQVDSTGSKKTVFSEKIMFNLEAPDIIAGAGICDSEGNTAPTQEYIYHNGVWRKARPFIYHNKEWWPVGLSGV